jgi:2-polyprenyl-6-methoxyphenol hydroxylase-like FAD-dependent oxidoreductase
MPVKFDNDDDDNQNQSHAVVDIYRCQGEKENDGKIQVDPIERISTDLLIAADGTSRTVANYMEETDQTERKSMNMIQRLFAGKPFSVTRYIDDNRRVYKTIPMKLPKDWRPDLNYSARSKGGGMNIDALPANRDGNYCGILLLKEDDPMAQANVDPETLRGFLNEKLPQFSPMLDDEIVAQVATKHPSFLPSFRFVGPRLNQGDHILILGDCAHTVKVRRY